MTAEEIMVILRVLFLLFMAFCLFKMAFCLFKIVRERKKADIARKKIWDEYLRKRK